MPAARRCAWLAASCKSARSGRGATARLFAMASDMMAARRKRYAGHTTLLVVASARESPFHL
eukprot:2655779-Pleurochrysis_carterae.AAC.1